MTQISPIPKNVCCPCCNQQCPTNNYNGVKIDIKNPAVNLPPAITAPIYDIPETSIYNKETPAPKVEEIK